MVQSSFSLRFYPTDLSVWGVSSATIPAFKNARSGYPRLSEWLVVDIVPSAADTPWRYSCGSNLGSIGQTKIAPEWQPRVGLIGFEFSQILRRHDGRSVEPRLLAAPASDIALGVTISLVLTPSNPERAPQQERAQGQGDTSESYTPIVFQLYSVRPKSICGREKGERRKC